MDYKVVFDVTRGFHHWPVLFCAASIVGTVWKLIDRRQSPSCLHQAILSFGLCGLLLCISLLAIGTSTDNSHLASALREGRCIVTEGVVTGFYPKPFFGHQRERFVVDGQSFDYSDDDETGGFNRSEARGGPIHLGIQVRVHSLHGKIARLEVAP